MDIMDPNAKSKCCGVTINELHKPDCPILKINREVLDQLKQEEKLHHVLQLQIAIAEFLIWSDITDNDRAKIRLAKRVDVVKKFLDKD